MFLVAREIEVLTTCERSLANVQRPRHPKFEKWDQDDKATDADFAIACDDQFTRNDNFLVGMAQVESLSERLC